jgi:hypothetical protein
LNITRYYSTTSPSREIELLKPSPM